MSSHDQQGQQASGTEAAKNQNRVAKPTRHGSLEQLGKEMDEYFKQQAIQRKLPDTYKEIGGEVDEYLKQQATEPKRDASLEQLGKEMDEYYKQQAVKPKLPGTYEEMGAEMDKYLKQQVTEPKGDDGVDDDDSDDSDCLPPGPEAISSHGSQATFTTLVGMERIHRDAGMRHNNTHHPLLLSWAAVVNGDGNMFEPSGSGSGPRGDWQDLDVRLSEDLMEWEE